MKHARELKPRNFSDETKTQCNCTLSIITKFSTKIKSANLKPLLIRDGHRI